MALLQTQYERLLAKQIKRHQAVGVAVGKMDEDAVGEVAAGAEVGNLVWEAAAVEKSTGAAIGDQVGGSGCWRHG